MARTENLNAILYFETVARRGTLSRAAEELSVSPSAVSQQIKLLEQQLGVKLFRRDGRQLSLTLEGEQLYQSAGTALRMLKDARRNLGRSRETRRLNLRVAPIVRGRVTAPAKLKGAFRMPYSSKIFFAKRTTSSPSFTSNEALRSTR